ncbi:MAG: hypothetical protein QOD11_2986 [Bradyrhizobium sp.]|jgi:hypothetical protein|nr:hypothetical protein [Bradyrhizobium sp.]
MLHHCRLSALTLKGLSVNIPARMKATRRHLVLGCLGLFVLLAGMPLHREALAQSVQSVRLVVDYGDGVAKIFDPLPWSKGNTVLDVLNAAKASPHGISFSYTGQGATAFLTDIDGVTNQGGGASAKNWQYWVNTMYADRSFAVFEVQATDTIFWRFTKAEIK